MKEIQLAKQIAEACECGYSQASSEELSQLKKLGVPDLILKFYAGFNPDNVAAPCARLISLKEMFEEISSLPPGSHVLPKGFLLFSFNDCGDGYCFDLQTPGAPENPRIVLFTHEEPLDFREREELLELFANIVADDLADFLEKIIEGTLPQEPK
jgi:hypothetical protein